MTDKKVFALVAVDGQINEAEVAVVDRGSNLRSKTTNEQKWCTVQQRVTYIEDGALDGTLLVHSAQGHVALQGWARARRRGRAGGKRGLLGAFGCRCAALSSLQPELLNSKM